MHVRTQHTHTLLTLKLLDPRETLGERHCLEGIHQEKAKNAAAFCLGESTTTRLTSAQIQQDRDAKPNIGSLVVQVGTQCVATCCFVTIRSGEQIKEGRRMVTTRASQPCNMLVEVVLVRCDECSCNKHNTETCAHI